MYHPDRRGHARITTHLTARLQTANGFSYAAIIRDISLSGMQIQLPSDCVPGVLPNAGRQRLNVPVEVLVECDLGEASKPSAIAVRCGIANLRRIAVDQCVIGVSFRSFLEKGESRLAHYWRKKAAEQHVTEPVA
jgi:PilZ domain